MKELSSIYDTLDITKFESDINIPVYNTAQPETITNTNNVTVNSNPTFNITGVNGEIDYVKVEELIREANEKLIDEITKY